MVTNRRKYTEDERLAINNKIINPNNIVICPRCGKEILYKEIGSSIRVKCETEGCISAGIRGI